MKCPNWGKILAAAALCAALCACSKPQDVLPDHIATPETSATVAPTAAVVQATTTPAPTDTTVPTILPQTADAVPQPPERCLSRQAGIVRCCLNILL